MSEGEFKQSTELFLVAESKTSTNHRAVYCHCTKLVKRERVTGLFAMPEGKNRNEQNWSRA